MGHEFEAWRQSRTFVSAPKPPPTATQQEAAEGGATDTNIRSRLLQRLGSSREWRAPNRTHVRYQLGKYAWRMGQARTFIA